MMNPQTVLIGLSGPKRVGKNYTAGVIKSQLYPGKYLYADLGFADALKEEVSEALKVSVDDLNGPNKEKFRPILQWWGTEFRREMFDSNYWIERLKEKLIRIEQSAARQGNLPAIMVVTDVRFRNEADLITGLGGVMWDITDPTMAPSTDIHPSETEMRSYEAYSAVLRNRRGFPDAYAAMVTLNLQKLGVKTRYDL